MPSPPCRKGYNLRLAGFLVAYALVLSGGLVLARAGAPVPVRILLALATAALILGVFWTIFRLLVEGADEYQRLLLVRQTLLAMAATSSLATCREFRRVFEVLADGPRWFGGNWLAAWGIAAPIVRWRA